MGEIQPSSLSNMLVNIIIPTKVVVNLEWTVGMEWLEWTVEHHLYLVLGSSQVGSHSQEVLLRGRVEPSPEVWLGGLGVGVSWAFPEKPDMSGKSSIFPRAPWSWGCPPETCWWHLLTFPPRDGEEHVCQRQRNTFTGVGQNYPTLMFFWFFFSHLVGWTIDLASYVGVWTAEYQVEGTQVPQRKSWICPEMEYWALKTQCFNGECDTQ